jgi:hypothetical protein
MGESKDKQINFTLLRQIINILKEDMENYHSMMFTHAMDSLEEICIFFITIYN